MENFAVDLDKVLDDFELNEGEQESSQHYDKLQLEFRGGRVPPIVSHSQNAPSLGATRCDWNDPTLDISTEEREPPDGQHDDENLGSVCQKTFSSGMESKNASSAENSSCALITHSNSTNLTSSLRDNKQNTDEKSPFNISVRDYRAESKVCEGEELWPNLQNHCTIFKDVSPLDNNNLVSQDVPFNANLNSPDINNLSTASGMSSNFSNQPLFPYPLDVLPNGVPSASGSSVLCEGQHPDILDMKLNYQEGNFHKKNFENSSLNPSDTEESSQRELEASGINQVFNNSSSDVQQEPYLLPDLMPVNNSDIGIAGLDLPPLLELSNPAVVTENSCMNVYSNNDPVIILESQSNNRIPEVVNIHQSAEQSNFGESNIEVCRQNKIYSNAIPAQPSINNEENAESIGFRAIKENTLVLNLKEVVEERGVSAVDQEERQNSSCVKFNPNLNIDDEELQSELQELEEDEDQATLQGAYKICDNQFKNEMSFLTSKSAESNNSNSPDLIGDIGSVNELVMTPIDKINETPCKIRENALQTLENIISGSSRNVTETNYQEDPKDQVNKTTNSENNESSANIPVSSDEIHSVEFRAENHVQDIRSELKATGNEEALSESTGTDTLSSTSTLTEGESALIYTDIEIPPDASSTPQEPTISPVRELPGSLVTAVYDDIGSSGGYSESQRDGNESDLRSIGAVAPFWIPDEEAPNCQECGMRFTLLKRRHHCRSCGRVLCAPCCHSKVPLPYMDFKEARVCSTCLNILKQANSEKEDDHAEGRQSGRSPNPNNPMEYCSRIPPQQQVGAVGNGPPPTVMVPVGVLKREVSNSGNGCSSRSRGSKQVIFSDGIRPGGDLTELGGQTRPSSPFRKMGRNTRRVAQNVPRNSNGGGVCSGGQGMQLGGELTPLRSVAPDACLIPSGGGLPPILLKSSANGEYMFDSNPDSSKLEEQMKEGEDPVVFALQKNLTVLVKQVKLDCCVGLTVWNVVTRGLCNVGQEELVVLLEVLPDEKSPPPHLFAFFHTVFQQANKGNFVAELSHTIFTEPEGFLGSKDNGGFLYVRPTYQCLQKLVLPPAPYVFALLIQKWETPWAKVFPLRLMLRLGAEFRYYPCPLVSVRNRKPVYCEIGHTIMNLLVDFRNYTYTISAIQGFMIHMEDKKTTLLIPRNRYEQILKALNNSNDHVLALGANFSLHADSHLVTVEDDDGHYSTQAINIHNKPRKVTGASFIVFNGALKSNSGLKAKSSIIEDGLMVQISGEMMTTLRDSLRNMRDFDIPCGPSVATEPNEVIFIRWVNDDKNFNIGIKSPIDGRQMDGIPSVKIDSGTDYVNGDYLIRWTEVFIIQGEASSSNNDINISRLSESLARACCMALIPHLALLYETGPNRLALRATIHQDNVEYEAGMGGTRLHPVCMKELDSELIPVIHRAATSITDQAVVLELLFHIMEQ